MKTRQWTYDLPLDDHDPPQPGDFLHHHSYAPRRPIRWFEVIDVRPVESSKWPNRWRLTLRPLDGAPLAGAAGARVHASWPYRSGETPASRMGVPE